MEKLKTWLKSFPLWDGGEPEVDRLSPLPRSCGLFPQGKEILASRENVLEEPVVTCRQKVLLRRLAPAGETANRWLTAFTQWVEQACLSGTAPSLGVGRTLWSAQGKLAKTDLAGLGTYEILLTAQYEEDCGLRLTEIYRMDGKAMPIPDAGVVMTFADVDAPESGRDEAGFYHRIPLRYKVGSWTFTYHRMGLEAYRYLESILPRNGSFLFHRPGATGEAESLCRLEKFEVTLETLPSGRYRDVTFTVTEC